MTGPWHGWADDAFVRDVDGGIFFGPARLHVPDHRRAEFAVRWLLNIARPPRAGR